MIIILVQGCGNSESNISADVISVDSISTEKINGNEIEETRPKVEEEYCVDSDNGLDYSTKGYIMLSGKIRRDDYCMDKNSGYKDFVMEYHCTDDGHGSTNYKCQFGCSDGKCNPEPEEVCIKNSRIIDGDTFVLEDGNKVRLIGIDTPETNEFYYQEAKVRLGELINGGCLTLTKDVSETDVYGRLLRYAYVSEIFINDKLVEEGYARATPYVPDTKYSSQFSSSESKAKNNKLGIWKKEVEKSKSQPSDSSYICNYNAYNCGDFKIHVEAQSVFEYCGGVSRDVHQLDRDQDGIACETLP